MHIAATQYTLNNEALEIYLSGCSGIDGEHCKNCHNPELWDYSVGTLCNENVSEKIKEKIINNTGLIKRVMIMGGEPLDQDSDELLKFINDIRVEGIEYWLFTRREIEEIPTEETPEAEVEEPEVEDERITELEERVANLENAINELMMRG